MDLGSIMDLDIVRRIVGESGDGNGRVVARVNPLVVDHHLPILEIVHAQIYQVFGFTIFQNARNMAGANAHI